MKTKITKREAEFFKIRNYSDGGKLKSIKYGDNYIRDLIYDERETPIPVFKGINIKIK